MVRKTTTPPTARTRRFGKPACIVAESQLQQGYNLFFDDDEDDDDDGRMPSAPSGGTDTLSRQTDKGRKVRRRGWPDPSQ